MKVNMAEMFVDDEIKQAAIDVIEGGRYIKGPNGRALGEEFARAAIAVARRAGLPLSAVNLIGSHGQTIYHIPPPRRRDRRRRSTGATLQIGEPSVIAERTGITTVADFRPRDMAAGGTGAPLAPYAHYLLFRNRPGTRIIQNIGGIANASLIPGGKEPEQVVAFDTGPGNMVVDGVVAELTEGEQHYDADGRWAARGTPNEKWLVELLKHPFIVQAPPKCTGREEFGVSYGRKLVQEARSLGISHEDLLATVTALSAESILLNYRRFLFPRQNKLPPFVPVSYSGGIQISLYFTCSVNNTSTEHFTQHVDET